jgi:hypothetical protein
LYYIPFNVHIIYTVICIPFNIICITFNIICITFNIICIIFNVICITFTIICITFTFISSLDPKSHVRYCHHLASVVVVVNVCILILYSEITGPIETKLGMNVQCLNPKVQMSGIYVNFNLYKPNTCFSNKLTLKMFLIFTF